MRTLQQWVTSERATDCDMLWCFEERLWAKLVRDGAPSGLSYAVPLDVALTAAELFQRRTGSLRQFTQEDCADLLASLGHREIAATDEGASASAAEG